MAPRRRRRRSPIKQPNLTPWWAVAGLIILSGATLLLVGMAIGQ